jgi:hypothetical protein
MSIQAYDINLAPAGSQGSTQIIEATAQICDFLTSGSAFDQIEVRPNFTQGAAVLNLGQGFDFGALVDRWLIVNKGATAIAGKVVLSSSGFRNFRISGDVNVLDGSKSRTLNGSAFAGNGGGNATAGQYAVGQLWNAAANSNRVVVEQISIIAAGASGVNVAVLIRNANEAGSVLQGQGISKKGGGAVAQAAMYSLSTATIVPAGNLMQLAAPSNGFATFKFSEPVVLPPGYGLTVWSYTLNATMGAQFEWYEEPNT